MSIQVESENVLDMVMAPRKKTALGQNPARYYFQNDQIIRLQ